MKKENEKLKQSLNEMEVIIQKMTDDHKYEKLYLQEEVY